MANKSNEQKYDVLAVTSVQVFPIEESPLAGHLKATATIVLNDQLVIRGLRVIDGMYGLYVAYPNNSLYKEEYSQSFCNPLTRQLREHIENCVLEKYQATIE
jgi:stage V sporulation protein G